MDSFVCKLYDSDSFDINGAEVVNLNDNHLYNYTFWNKSRKLYRIPNCFTNEALDLFYLSLMVFYADRKIQRNNQADRWTRDIEIYMPVFSVQKWTNNAHILKAALDFLTGDNWTIHFRERYCLTDDEIKYKNGRYRYRNSIKKVDADAFCMLSGGLDSFIGAIDLLSEGNKPIFVGNYNGGKGVSVYQKRVIESLIAHFNVPKEHFYQFYAAPKRGKEDTTRSRSLLFFSHAILLASGMGKPIKLYIPENGVISMNIPLTEHRMGSLSTRTTHPYFMELLQTLISNIGLNITLENPYQFKTKGEMMEDCKDFDYLSQSYVLTMSCSHPDLGRWKKERESNHCGVCLPCTIRRAAIHHAGIIDNSKYRDPEYKDAEAEVNLRSYQLGLSRDKEPLFAIQESGPIKYERRRFAELYQRGLEELKQFIDTL